MSIRAALLLTLVTAARKDDSRPGPDAAVSPAVAMGICDAPGSPASLSERDDAFNWKEFDEDVQAFMRGRPPAPRSHDFGEGPSDALATDPMDAPVMAAASSLMRALTRV